MKFPRLPFQKSDIGIGREGCDFDFLVLPRETHGLGSDGPGGAQQGDFYIHGVFSLRYKMLAPMKISIRRNRR
jgi:hypothetical protein